VAEEKKKIILSTQLRIPRGLVERVDVYLDEVNVMRERDGFPPISRNSFICEAVEKYVETHRYPA
jgi:hypothetical protein